MLTKWCIIISDVDLINFALIGPFDTQGCAEEVEDELYQCNVVTSVHPYSKGLGWIGKAAKDRLETTRLIKAQDAESHEEYRQAIFGSV